MNKPVGGRGNKADYTTTHVRIPEPIKETVNKLADYYRQVGCVPHLNLVTSLDEVEQEEENVDDSQDLSTLETIKEQAAMIRAYASEIHYLKHKLHQTESLTSLDDAIKLARYIVTQKKSANVSLVKLLTDIYQVDLNPQCLREAETTTPVIPASSFIQRFRSQVDTDY